MIITVGTGNDVWNAIIFSIKRQNPDTILFIVTDDSKDKTLKLVYENIKLDEYKIQERICNEINDVEILTIEYSKYIKDLIGSGFNASQIVADYTSGTKPMSAALIYAAIQKEIETISYVYGQRGEEGKVKTGSERLNTLSPTAIYTDKKIEMAINFFNKYQYFTALEILSDSTLEHPSYKEKIKLLQKITEAYLEWDKFNFEKASTLLNEASCNKEADTIINRPIIEKHKQILHQLKSSKNPNDYLIADLLANANRRGLEGKFDDAMARLYRCIEMLGQSEFFKHYQFSTSEIQWEKLPDTIKSDLDSKFPNKNKVEIGLADCFRILKTLEKPVAKTYYESESEIKKILHIRNYSILAHGVKPVEREKFEDFFKIFSDRFKITIQTEFPKINSFRN